MVKISSFQRRQNIPGVSGAVRADPNIGKSLAQAKNNLAQTSIKTFLTIDENFRAQNRVNDFADLKRDMAFKNQELNEAAKDLPFGEGPAFYDGEWKSFIDKKLGKITEPTLRDMFTESATEFGTRGGLVVRQGMYTKEDIRTQERMVQSENSYVEMAKNPSASKVQTDATRGQFRADLDAGVQAQVISPQQRDTAIERADAQIKKDIETAKKEGITAAEATITQMENAAYATGTFPTDEEIALLKQPIASMKGDAQKKAKNRLGDMILAKDAITAMMSESDGNINIREGIILDRQSQARGFIGDKDRAELNAIRRVRKERNLKVLRGDEKIEQPGNEFNTDTGLVANPESKSLSTIDAERRHQKAVDYYTPQDREAASTSFNERSAAGDHEPNEKMISGMVSQIPPARFKQVAENMQRINPRLAMHLNMRMSKTALGEEVSKKMLRGDAIEDGKNAEAIRKAIADNLAPFFNFGNPEVTAGVVSTFAENAYDIYKTLNGKDTVNAADVNAVTEMMMGLSPGDSLTFNGTPVAPPFGVDSNDFLTMWLSLTPEDYVSMNNGTYPVLPNGDGTVRTITMKEMTDATPIQIKPGVYVLGFEQNGKTELARNPVTEGFYLANFNGSRQEQSYEDGTMLDLTQYITPENTGGRMTPFEQAQEKFTPDNVVEPAPAAIQPAPQAAPVTPVTPAAPEATVAGTVVGLQEQRKDAEVKREIAKEERAVIIQKAKEDRAVEDSIEKGLNDLKNTKKAQSNKLFQTAAAATLDKIGKRATSARDTLVDYNVLEDAIINTETGFLQDKVFGLQKFATAFGLSLGDVANKEQLEAATTRITSAILARQSGTKTDADFNNAMKEVAQLKNTKAANLGILAMGRLKLDRDIAIDEIRQRVMSEEGATDDVVKTGQKVQKEIAKWEKENPFSKQYTALRDEILAKQGEATNPTVTPPGLDEKFGVDAGGIIGKTRKVNDRTGEIWLLVGKNKWKLQE